MDRKILKIIFNYQFTIFKKFTIFNFQKKIIENYIIEN
jgi:hypothetical protein